MTSTPELKLNASKLKDGPFSWLPPTHPALSALKSSNTSLYKAISAPKPQFPDSVGISSTMPSAGSPPLVIRGERSEGVKSESGESVHQYWVLKQIKKKNALQEVLEIPLKDETANGDAAIIDTLTFTIKEDRYQEYANYCTDDDMSEFISRDLQLALGLKLGGPIQGKNFYREGRSIEHVAEGAPSANLGFVCWGGNKDTFCVHLTGEACEHINLGYTFSRLRKYLELLEATITRIDLAHDDLEGEHSVDLASEWYLSDGFNVGGRRPTCSQVGDWLSGEDIEGRTLYVGKRQNGKQMCIYEKGKQKGSLEYPNWVRFEGRLGSTGRVIPYETLTVPGQYLAAMYPCLGWISEKQVKIKTTVKARFDSDIDTRVKNANRQCGKVVYVLRAMGKPPEEIIELLASGQKMPRWLTGPNPVDPDRIPDNFTKTPASIDSIDPFGMIPESISNF